MPGYNTSYQTGVRGKHLVRADQREPATKNHDDGRRDTGQRFVENHVSGNIGQATSLFIVIPVHTVQISRMGIVGRNTVGRGQDGRRNARRVRKFGECRQHDPRIAQVLDSIFVGRLIDDILREIKWYQFEPRIERENISVIFLNRKIVGIPAEYSRPCDRSLQYRFRV